MSNVKYYWVISLLMFILVVATPRIAFSDWQLPVRYEIHAQVVAPNFKGPQTIINLYSPR